jgi:hypothetical protein
MKRVKVWNTSITRLPVVRWLIGVALISTLMLVATPLGKSNNTRAMGSSGPISRKKRAVSGSSAAWTAVRSVRKIKSFDAEPIELFQFRDHLAVANFNGSDPSGCPVKLTLVGLSDNEAILNNGTPGLFLLIWDGDVCTGQDHVFVQTRVPVPISDFTLSPNLRSARLNTTLPVCNLADGNCFDVSIDLTWTADGPVLTQPFHNFVAVPGVVVSGLFFNSFWRVGQVSGSINNGSADYTWGVAPVGVITKTVQGSITIQILPS